MDRIRFKAISDVGLIRDNNEDTFIAERLWDDHHILCAVIDGVGGYEGGEVAAEITRSSIIGFLNNYPDNNLQDVIAQAVLQANNNIYEQRQNGPLPNMSCVVSAAIIDTQVDKVYVAHVGDSRIYLYGKGILTKITHDHSLVGYREEIGELSENEAMNHPRRNIIERCLGEKERVLGEANFIDSAVFDIPVDGKLVFCSDGLTDMVTQAEIKQILVTDRDTDSKCQMLVDCAKKHGGEDNVTVILVETNTNIVSSDGVEISYLSDSTRAESDKENNPLLSENNNESKVANIKRHSWPNWLLILFALLVGFIIGLLFGKREKSLDGSQDITESQLVDTSGFTLDNVSEPEIISFSKYLLYANDSLRTVISSKDSLIKELLDNF